MVALLGFADATYLAVEHFLGVVPPCSVTSGCENVLTSSYSIVLGIPVSLVGSIYYLFILIALFAYIEGKHEKMLRYALPFTIFGLLGSIWLVSVMAFIIKSYCIYCLGSATTSTILFITAVYTLRKYGADSAQVTV